MVFFRKSSPIHFFAWFLHLPGFLTQLVWLLSPFPPCLASEFPLKAQKYRSHVKVAQAMRREHIFGCCNEFVAAPEQCCCHVGSNLCF